MRRLSREEREGSPLARAAALGDSTLAATILASPDAPHPDELGQALTNMADAGDVPMMDLPLAAGADPDWHPPGMSCGFPLRQALYWYHIPAVTLLLDAGADVNAADERGDTPLHDAVAYEADWIQIGAITPTTELTALLVAREVDVRARNAAGETPADVAAR